MTKSGMTNAAIWIELPTQIPIVSSILPFIAIQTDVTCSAAFATIGNSIIPMKAFGIEYRSAVSSIDATTVKTQNINAAVGRDREQANDNWHRTTL